MSQTLLLVVWQLHLIAYVTIRLRCNPNDKNIKNLHSSSQVLPGTDPDWSFSFHLSSLSSLCHMSCATLHSETLPERALRAS
eukprot:2433072-Amphidinium_carterae.1